MANGSNNLFESLDWTQRQPSVQYPQSGGNIFSSFGNTVAAGMNRPTGAARLQQGLIRNKRMGALRQVRDLGLDPTMGNMYYEKLGDLLSEAGDFAGAEMAHNRAIKAREQHDARLLSEAKRPFIDESVAIAMETARDSTPARKHERERQLEKDKIITAIETRGLGGGSGLGTGSSSKTDKPASVDKAAVSALFDSAISDPDSGLFDHLIRTNPAFEPYQEAFKAGDFTESAVSARAALVKDPIYTSQINKVVTAAKELQKKHPGMTATTAASLAMGQLKGQEIIISDDGSRRLLDRSSGRSYRVGSDGTLRREVVQPEVVQPEAMEEVAPNLSIATAPQAEEVVNAGGRTRTTSPSLSENLGPAVTLLNKIESGETYMQSVDVVRMLDQALGGLGRITDYLTDWMTVQQPNFRERGRGNTSPK